MPGCAPQVVRGWMLGRGLVLCRDRPVETGPTGLRRFLILAAEDSAECFQQYGTALAGLVPHPHGADQFCSDEGTDD